MIRRAFAPSLERPLEARSAFFLRTAPVALAKIGEIAI